MLILTRNDFQQKPESSDIVIYDRLTNRHILVRQYDLKSNRSRIGIEADYSYGVYRKEVLSRYNNSNQFHIWSALPVVEVDSDFPLAKHQELKFLVGCYVEGIVSGTEDVIRRGYVHAILGDPGLHPEPPCRLLVQDHLQEWFVLQIQGFFGKNRNHFVVWRNVDRPEVFEFSMDLSGEGFYQTNSKLIPSEILFWKEQRSVGTKPC